MGNNKQRTCCNSHVITLSTYELLIATAWLRQRCIQQVAQKLHRESELQARMQRQQK